MKRSRQYLDEVPDLSMAQDLVQVLQHLPCLPAVVGVVARLRQVNRQFAARSPAWFSVPGRWQFGSNVADQLPVLRSLMARRKTSAMLRALGYRGRVDLLTTIKPELRRNEALMDACEGAAAGGQLDTLRWSLGGNSYPWSDTVIVAAAKHGHVHVLRWLAAADYPKPSEAYEAACRANRPDVIDCLEELGYRPPRLQFALVNPTFFR